MLLRGVAIVLLFVALAVSARGQQYHTRLIDVARGLPSNEINSVATAPDGTTWIATQDGLCRWNGRGLSTYLPSLSDSTSIRNVRVYSVLRAPNGSMYFVTVNGIARFDAGRQAFVNTYPTGNRADEPFRGATNFRLVNDTVFRMNITTGSAFGDGSAALLRIGDVRTGKSAVATVVTGENERAEPILGDGQVFSDASGSLWALTQHGIAERKSTDTTFRVRISTLPDAWKGARFVADTADGAWYIEGGQVRRVHLKRGEMLAPLPLPSGFDAGAIDVALRVAGGTLVLRNTQGMAVLVSPNPSTRQWVASLVKERTTHDGSGVAGWTISSCSNSMGMVAWTGRGGISVLDTRTSTLEFLPIPAATLDQDLRVFADPVSIDEKGRITVNIPLVGVVVADPYRPLPTFSAALPYAVASVILDEDRMMMFTWPSPTDPEVYVVNTRSGSVAYYDVGERSLQPNSAGRGRQGRSTFHCAYRSREGTVWVGSTGVIRAISPYDMRVKTYIVNGSARTGAVESDIIVRFVETKDGSLWAATDHGRFEYNNHTDAFEFRPPTGALRDFTVNDAVVGVAVSPKGEEWVYGYKHIGTMSANGAITPIELRPEDDRTEPLASVKCMVFSDRGLAYVVDRRGVAEIDLDRHVYRRVRSPFVPVGREPYLGAAPDHMGTLWLVTPAHIESFNPRTKRFRLIPFDNAAQNPSRQSTLFPRRGNVLRIVLVRSNNVSVFDPQNVPPVRNDLTVQLTSLLLRDTLHPLERSLNEQDSLVVNFTDSPFTIRFTAADPTYGPYLRFRYLLEGYDERWIETSDPLEARYQNVGEGEYTFRVQVFDIDGEWKEPRQPLTVIVEPAWWQTAWLKICIALGIIGVGVVFYRSRVRTITERNKQLENIVEERTRDLREEQRHSDQLLLNVLPAQIAARLKKGERSIADSYTAASVLFADLVGFTPLTSSLAPQEVVRVLNELFSRFDRAALDRGVERIKTIGDGYMAAAGIPDPTPDHAVRMANFALDLVSVIRTYSAESGYDLHLRIGINCGDVVAAIVGESRFAYDIWGDAVNVAARMEGLSEPDRVHCTEAFVAALGSSQSAFIIASHGTIDVKGKGLMATYWLDGWQS